MRSSRSTERPQRSPEDIEPLPLGKTRLEQARTILNAFSDDQVRRLLWPNEIQSRLAELLEGQQLRNKVLKML